MADTTVTVVGNVTRDPEVRFTPNGKTVVTFGVAVNKRVKEGNEWVDGEPEFYDVKAWDTLGENLAESIVQGNRVLVVGRLDFRSWEADDGSKRSKIELVADHAGPDLRWATAEVTKIRKGEGGGSKPAPRQAPPAWAAYDEGDSDPF